jgi:ubiquinone biosynthesis protein Coq4
MTDMEKLQKACETLAEAWNKALEALEPMEKLAKALNDAFGRMYASEEEKRKICNRRRHKSVKHVPDSKMSTYNYMPAVKHNLPYQRRNF